MKITEKQEELFNAYKSGKYNILALGGGTSSAKTIGILALFNHICNEIPNVRIVVFRKSEKNHKQNTIPSFRKILQFSNTKDVIIRDMEARYPNGSVILFNWADITKDPNVDNVRGLECSIVFFNEANQMDKQYFDIAKTRVGRWNDIKCEDGEGRIKPAIFLDFNPNNAWVKGEFYDKYMDDALPKGTFFQLSLPTDNPFNNADYLKMLETLPLNEYKRYVLGNWEYDDNPAQLITYEMYKDCRITQEELDGMIDRDELKGDALLSIDPSDEGKDSTAFTYLKGKVFYKYEKDQKLDEIKAAHLAKERIVEHNIVHTIVDSIGVGAGTAKTLIYANYLVYQFVAGEKPVTEEEFYHFKNKRAEAGWWLRKSMKELNIFFLHNSEVQKQLLSIEYETDDRVIKIAPKKLIKKKLGYSPDYYDSIVMGNYLRLIHEGIIQEQEMIENLDNYVTTSEDMAEKYDW